MGLLLFIGIGDLPPKTGVCLNNGLALKLDYYDPEVEIIIIKKNVSKSLYWAKSSANNGNADAAELMSE